MSTTRLFTAEHDMLRKAIRAFVDKEVVPHVDEWEEAGRIPRTFWRRLGELGFLGLEFPAEYGGGGDFVSSVVLGEETARLCRGGRKGAAGGAENGRSANRPFVVSTLCAAICSGRRWRRTGSGSSPTAASCSR